MPAIKLTIGGVADISTRVDSYSLRYEYEVAPERNWLGDLHAMVTEYRNFVRVWTLATPYMPTADARTLLAELRNAGTVLVDGDLVGTKCHVRAPGLDFLPGSTLDASVSYELVETKAIGGDRREYLRVQIADATGALQDVTRYSVGGNIVTSVEQMATECDLTFLRETWEGSNNPLVVGESGAFNVARECRVRFAYHDIGDTLTEADWWYPFSGRVYSYSVGGKRPLMGFRGRDWMGRIIKHQIDRVRRYGSAVATSPSVVQAMLTNELPALGLTITDPDAIDQNIQPFDQAMVRLSEAIQRTADVSGAMFHQFTDSAGEPEYRLWQPDIEKTTPDITFAEGEYYEVEHVEKTLDHVRNRAVVIIRGPDDPDGYLSVEVEADESDDPERQTIILDASGNPLVTTEAAGAAWGRVVLQDTTFAPLAHRVSLPIRKEVALGQLIRWPADGVTTGSALDSGVVGYSLSLAPDGNSMSIDGAVRVRGSRTRWDVYEWRSAETQATDPGVGPVTVSASDIAGRFTTSAGSANYTEESDGASSLGGFGSTTPVPLTLDALFQKITEAERAAGRIEYRSIWFPNISADGIEWPDVNVFFSKLATGGVAFALASDPVGIVDYDGTDQSYISASETAAPDDGGGTALVWVAPDDYTHGDVITVGTVEALKGFFLHVRLTVDAGATGQITDEAIVARQVTPT